MAEEFHAGVCGGGWWNMDSSRSVLAGGSAITSHDMGWGLDLVDMKTTRSCHDQDSNNSALADSFQTSQKPQQQQQTDSDHSGGSSNSTVLIDSTLQVLGFGLQSSSDWNRALLSTGEDSSVLNNFTAMNQEFCLDQQRQNSINTRSNCTTSCESLSAGFPVSATASYGYNSTVIQSLLFEPADDPQSAHQSLFNNYPSNYGTDLNDQLMPASWPQLSPNNYLKPSLPKQLQPTSLHFTNNKPFLVSSSGTALNDEKAARFFHSTQQAQFLGPSTFEKKPDCSTLATTVNKGSSNEPAFKRPRMETPSPLPTFKVRKEKLGDRITALQQLVSPFGKTDTASVLHEAIDYIKFLHDQVNVLSTPYMKNGHPIQQVQQSFDKLNSSEGVKQDLKSRGLCLVPISSTFPVSNETSADFWTPTFGGTFR
ncbi:transcription factor bHLH112-like isoform X2 [Tripterygium wilfordii]|nr:transcription factor bHLH112-like isoform X2 [Tripterygium wilfordii]